MTKILIVGDGAMGQTLKKVASQKGVCVLGTVGFLSETSLTSPFELEENPDCVVDFSHREFFAKTAEYCKTNKVPLVLGTTNLSSAQEELLRSLSQCVAVCHSNNFSVGVAVLKKALKEILAWVENFDFDIEIRETHHAKKRDAPSGTAKDLMTVVKESRDASFVFGREGFATRQKNEVGVFSLRGGSVVGKHAVELLGQSESILLQHDAWDKSVFALGALRVAQKICGLPCGSYDYEYFL